MLSRPCSLAFETFAVRSRNGVATSAPFATIRTRPAFSTTNSRASPGGAARYKGSESPDATISTARAPGRESLGPGPLGSSDPVHAAAARTTAVPSPILGAVTQPEEKLNLCRVVEIVHRYPVDHLRVGPPAPTAALSEHRRREACHGFPQLPMLVLEQGEIRPPGPLTLRLPP